VFAAGLADRDPPTLCLNKIGSLSHSNKGRQNTKECSLPRFILTERIVLADRS
jgi:hypothetical protein